MSVARRIIAVCAGIAVGLGMVVAPPVTAATKVPGKTIFIGVGGLPRGSVATVKVKGPKKYRTTLQVDRKAILRALKPSRYTLRAKPVGTMTATTPVQKVRVKKRKGARVIFTYQAAPTQPGADTTAPGPVTDLKVASSTDTSVTLMWTNPTDPDLARVIVRRGEGRSVPRDPTMGIEVPTKDAPETATDTGLSPELVYIYAVFAQDASGNTSRGALVKVRVGAQE
jgi:hypothetical protein